METRKRLAKIVLVFVGLFALCWFPNHVLYMYRSFHYHQMDLSLAHLVITLLARVLSFSSSCVNPFALYLLSESFRRHFNRFDLFIFFSDTSFWLLQYFKNDNFF